MKAKAHIEIDFQLAIRQAERLEEIASKLISISGNMLQITDTFFASWSGENARIYIQKHTQVREEMKRASEELREVACNIRCLAKRVYDAEMRAYEIAVRRINGN